MGKTQVLYTDQIRPSISNITEDHILGFTGSRSENFININDLLLSFKYYIFNSRSNKYLRLLQLKTDIIKVKTLEEVLSNGDNNKRIKAKNVIKSGKR